MKVLFVTTEMDDFVRVGGLAAVSAALPRALRTWTDIRVLLPGYTDVVEQLTHIQIVGECAARAEMPPCQLARASTRDGLPVYVLLPGKGDAKLKEITTDEAPTINGGSQQGVFFHAQPVSRFTFMLTRRMDRPVIDQTGLKGRYDFTIDLSGLGFGGRDPEGPGGPSVFTTVQRDLGLRLEARKEPISILVIDFANRMPTEN